MDDVFQHALNSHFHSKNGRMQIKRRQGTHEHNATSGNKDNITDENQQQTLLLPASSSPSPKFVVIIDKASETKGSSTSSLQEVVPVSQIAKAVNPDNVEEDTEDILRVVRPNWVEERAKDGVPIVSNVLVGGMTNRLFTFSRPSDPDPKDTLVIKIYGENTDRLVDRFEENETLQLLHEYGCGPQLYAVFENGVCYEYLHGEPLGEEKCKRQHVCTLIAKELARLHNIPLEEEIINDTGTMFSNESNETGTTMNSGVAIWGKMRRFVELLDKQIFAENPNLKMKFQVESFFTVNKAKEHIDQLEGFMERQGMPVAFCHNDLSFGNIIYNESKSTVKFIDFEFAMPNYIPYDVANYFNAFAGIKKPDYSSLPGASFKKSWIGAYVRSYKECIKEGPDTKICGFTQSDFENWVDTCIPASHLFWTLWAAVQSGQGTSSDFDYAWYSGMRYGEFLRSLRTLSSQEDISFAT